MTELRPAPPPRWIGPLKSLAGVAALGGWLILVVWVVVILGLRSGRAVQLVSTELSTALGPNWLAMAESVTVSLPDRRVRLGGLHLSGPGLVAELDRVDAILRLGASGALEVEHIDIQGGRVAQTLEPAEEPDSTGSPSLEIPFGSLEWSDLELIQRRGREEWALGEIEGAWRKQGDGWEAGARVALPQDLGQPLHVRGWWNGSKLEAVATSSGIDLEVLRSLPALPEATRDQLTNLALTGRLELKAHAEGTSLDPEALAGELQARVTALSAEALVAETAEGPLRAGVTEGEMDLLARWTGRGWQVSGTGQARARRVPIDVDLEGEWSGTERMRLDAWVQVPLLSWQEDVAPFQDVEPSLREVQGMLEPDGPARASLWLAAVLEGGELELPHEILIEPLEGSTIRYVGEVGERGVRDLGFPLPVSAVGGRVWVGHALELALDRHVVLAELAAAPKKGEPVLGEGMITHASDLPEDELGRFLLHLQSASLPVDTTLLEALDGLAGVEAVPWAQQEFQPTGGAMGIDLTLQTIPAARALATTLDIELNGTSSTWAPLDLGLSNLDGRVSVRSTPVDEESHRTVTRFALEGRAPGLTPRVAVEGHVRAGSDDPGATRVEVNAPALAIMDPTLLEQLGTPSSSLLSAARDLEAETRLTAHGLGEDLVLEGSARLLSPLALGDAAESPRVTGTFDFRRPLQESAGATASLLLADLRTGEPLIVAEARGAELEQLRASAHGLRAEDPRVREQLTNLGVPPIEAQGALDAWSTVELFGEVARPSVELRLDLDQLLIPGFDEVLTEVRGEVLAPTHGGLEAEALTLRAAGVDFALADLDLHVGETEIDVTTLVNAANVPVDRRRLGLLLGRETGVALAEELEARGELSFTDTRLAVRAPGGSPVEVELEGRVGIREGHLRLGLPIEVDQVGEALIRLRTDGGPTRATARLRGLDARIAGRRLEGADFTLTYVEPRVSIEELEGQFEGGSLSSLGLSEPGTASFFAMDLAAPFPFDLAARWTEVDVGELTRGLFQSEFANQGRTRGNLRVSGRLGDPVGIRGSGRVELRDSALWAIPVFQALFASLGFDRTGVIDSMETWLDLEDGRIEMTGMRLKSDLLSLVGAGTLDLEGDLDYQLEVRYSLVDKLALLNRLFYELQDQLIRVSIRGDMARPIVVPLGIVSGLFAAPKEGLHLPLPALSPIPRVWR